MRYCLVILWLLVSCCFACAQDDRGGVVIYGQKHAFTLSAPQGWVLDSTAGKSDGLQAVFYPKGGSWADSEAVMYVNTSPRQGDPPETLKSLIQKDVDEFKGAVVTNLAGLPLAGGRLAIVRQFTAKEGGNIEAVAYLEEKTVFVMLVLSSRNQAAFDAAYPAFKELVTGYTFLTTDVEHRK